MGDRRFDTRRIITHRARSEGAAEVYARIERNVAEFLGVVFEW